MRVISGKAKGISLMTPKGDLTRPTADRVKEALFSILHFDLPGARVLDLFGGTGQLGIEALSRGAASAVFVDTREESCRLIRENPKVKAIGEIGLDYHYEDIPRDVQQAAFRAQMALAAELNLPVIVHERDAHEDGLAIVKAFPEVKGVFHCFSGSAELARQLTDLGWYIGFTGVLTFKNARRAIEAAQAIPLERIVIETDCPYMSPEPFRGKRNDPGRLYRMAERLAEIRGVSVEEIHRITVENGKRLYRIE